VKHVNVLVCSRRWAHHGQSWVGFRSGEERVCNRQLQSSSSTVRIRLDPQPSLVAFDQIILRKEGKQIINTQSEQKKFLARFRFFICAVHFLGEVKNTNIKDL
jgi:hypothetical protein